MPPRGDVGSADAQEVIGASAAHHRQTRHTKTRSTGDRDWEREALGRSLAAPHAEPQVVPAAALAASGTVSGTIRIGAVSSQCAARQGEGSADDTDGGQQCIYRSTAGCGGVMIGTSHVMYRITTRVAVDERMLPAALLARVRVSPPSFPVDEAAFPPTWGAHSFMQRSMHGLFLRTSAARGARPRCTGAWRLTSLYRNQSTWCTDRCKRVRDFSVDPRPSAHDRFACMHIHVDRYTIEMPVTVCHKIQIQASALALSPDESALSLALYLPSGTTHSVCRLFGMVNLTCGCPPRRGWGQGWQGCGASTRRPCDNDGEWR